METLTHHDIIILLVQLALMLLAARLFGELARKLNQPMVVGEIIAGVILGPTVFGYISPELFNEIFLNSPMTNIALDGIIQVAVILLLFIAGLEVELDLVWEQGKRALYTSLMSLTFPFIIGFTFVYSFPGVFNSVPKEQYLVFTLFLSTVLSITALPVIARVLMDLNMFKSKMGMLIIASAMVIDIIGWLIFAVILSMIDTGVEEKISFGKTIGLTLGFTVFVLSIGKYFLDKILPWINRKFAWPGGLLSISMVLCFIASAFTEYIGIHAIFGAFIMGIALGDSVHMPERAKEIVHQFVNNIFAPLFFVSIGLWINFIENFNPTLIMFILVLAFLGKITGGFIGARMGKLNVFQSLAVGFGMNTHGTLEIILGTIVLGTGLINEEIFVSIVIMIIITIIISAPMMKYCIELHKHYKRRYKVKMGGKDEE